MLTASRAIYSLPDANQSIVALSLTRHKTINDTHCLNKIAGHAISTARHLVTHNSSEFSRIERLHWEDWKTDQRWKDKPKKMS